MLRPDEVSQNEEFAGFESYGKNGQRTVEVM